MCLDIALIEKHHKRQYDRKLQADILLAAKEEFIIWNSGRANVRTVGEE